MENVECPACAGPAENRKDCATCNGQMVISSEQYAVFMANAEKIESLNNFFAKVFSFSGLDGDYLFEDGEMRHQYSNGVFLSTPLNKEIDSN